MAKRIYSIPPKPEDSRYIIPSTAWHLQPINLSRLKDFKIDIDPSKIKFPNLLVDGFLEEVKELPELTGYREIHDEPENLNKYPHLPAAQCKRKQHLRLKRSKPKMRVPFPVPRYESPGQVYIEPWMLHPLATDVPWETQDYKEIDGTHGVYPSCIPRWEAYPPYDMDEASKYYQLHPPLTLSEEVVARKDRRVKFPKIPHVEDRTFEVILNTLEAIKMAEKYEAWVYQDYDDLSTVGKGKIVRNTRPRRENVGPWSFGLDPPDGEKGREEDETVGKFGRFGENQWGRGGYQRGRGGYGRGTEPEEEDTEGVKYGRGFIKSGRGGYSTRFGRGGNRGYVRGGRGWRGRGIEGGEEGNREESRDN